MNGLREIFDTVNTPGQTIYGGMFEVRPRHIVRFGRKGLPKRAYWSLQAAPRTALPEGGIWCSTSTRRISRPVPSRLMRTARLHRRKTRCRCV